MAQTQKQINYGAWDGLKHRTDTAVAAEVHLCECAYESNQHTFMTAGVPPIFCTSSMTYLPDGFRSAKKGTLSDVCSAWAQR
jgi:hypothetical protein